MQLLSQSFAASRLEAAAVSSSGAAGSSGLAAGSEAVASTSEGLGSSSEKTKVRKMKLCFRIYNFYLDYLTKGGEE